MKKTMVFTDIHFGEKGNSITFNKDCLDYIDWLVEQAKKENIKQCFFLGDYFHVRSSINVNTLNYAIKGIRKLSEYFDDVVMILGNHDLYYRESLEVNSMEFAKEFSNVHLIDSITEFDGVTFVPWLVGNMHQELSKIKTQYLCGHFEIPGFYLNSMVKMPDIGHMSVDHFGNSVEYVLTGHFHKRQVQHFKNGPEIHYIGNAFPHNFSDTNDTSRGACIIEDDEEPRYLNWEDTPNYLQLPLSELLESPETYINSKTYAKVVLDLNIAYDDALFIRETFMKLFEAREIAFVHEKKESLDYVDDEDLSFDTVDTIVIKSLDVIESKTIDKNKLISIYNTL